MADVQPLQAFRYDTAVVGDLSQVVAPPYDVIDPAQRQGLLARSPFNVVAVDLPQKEPGGRDPYEAAGQLFAGWQQQGAIKRDAEPSLFAHIQDYSGPDGVARTRRGFFCRVRIEGYGPGRVRPHERTHPGPKEDRLRLTRATKANTSPIFSLYSDPQQAAWAALEPVTAQQQPWADVTDGDGTRHRLWQITDPAAIAAVQAATADAELLIADGHHRYETMDAYAQEVGGEGPHRYILMCLVALQDPGLTIFPTHRLVRDLDEARWAALDETIARDFDVTEVDVADIAPAPSEEPTPLTMGYIDRRTERPLRLTLKDQAIADRALAEHTEPYRHLDTGVLETILLKGALGLSDDDISHFNGMFYARDTEEAVAMVRSGEYDAAFVMRPTPVRQVRELAAEGENMPPKSTFFYPKLLTGLLFNPLA
jgi:uncharacterized protein (DUF1015 family)